jgi:predicted nucleic acid-binding protein
LSFLLDTNVVSEIRRGRDQHVRAWVGEVNDVDLHLSVLTLGEIAWGWIRQGAYGYVAGLLANLGTALLLGVLFIVVPSSHFRQRAERFSHRRIVLGMDVLR